MQRPQNLWEQFTGKARAEGARGCGIWPVQSHPCHLEPPWEPFDRQELTLWDAAYNGWQAPWEGQAWKRWLFPPTPLLSDGDTISLSEFPHGESSQLARILVEQFPEDASTIAKSDVFLRTLASLTAPVSFEILGMGAQPQFDHEKAGELLAAGQNYRLSETIHGWTEPYVKTQFVAHPSDAKQVAHQLLAQYPNSAVLATNDDDSEDWEIAGDIASADGYGSTLSLLHPYCQRIRIFTKLDPDPLGVVLAAMDHLDRRDWALVQILFQPVSRPWSESLRAAMSNPYSGKFWFHDITPRLLDDKFSDPLFAVSIRLATRTREAYKHLQGWADQFAAPPQGFDFLLDDDEAECLAEAIQYRCTFRPGMLLNIAELASLVHLPGESIVSERLKRVKTRTRPARDVAQLDGSIILGDNIHRGVTKPARISGDKRLEHCYIAGATGTGKSTLMLNLILQDIAAGRGVGVLDPHGDLIHDVLCRIPDDRIDDVVLFDPSDDQFPVALNILEAQDEGESQRIVNETVMALERHFLGSWGPRLQMILSFTLYSVLDAIPDATLADVERMLTDEKLRQDTIFKIKDPQCVAFWNNQFSHMGKTAADPVLNKLSPFLVDRTVRNIICQRHASIDFDHVLNDGKILLANLSSGKLTESIGGTLGSFLVTKIVNAAFRRAKIPEDQRRPWYLYVDEFQNFMNLSVGFERILTQSRKYKLVLAGLANQYVGQLTPTVRQAIFGNIGTLVVFRLGVEDAQAVAKELGVFTPSEILNQNVGEAIVRSGQSEGAFNLQSHPKSDPSEVDPTHRVQRISRTRYARPVAEVEAEFGATSRLTRIPTASDVRRSANLEDPNEDALVV